MKSRFINPLSTLVTHLTRSLFLALLFGNCTNLMAQVKIEKIDYQGWPNCHRVTNGTIELIATTDIGPRIISFSFAGEKNLFYVREDFAGKTGGEEWRNYGGHRLWHAPEDKVRTYQPDNALIEVSQIKNGLRLTAPVEKLTGIQKTIEVTLHPTKPEARVLHRLRNIGRGSVELAPWAISVMSPGGFAISPLPTKFHPDRLLPNRQLALWPYTDVRDDRYYLGTDYVLLRHKAGNEGAKERAKIGIANNVGWAAYYLKPYLFVKRFNHIEGARYPDLGSSVELFTNNRILELETLGPLVTLKPGAEVSYEERWELHNGVELEFSEGSVKANLPSLVDKP
ncbi:MAG: hypothetical protein H0T92_23045 [Pyrinomonadaceae bacterium]|nr:hypothetical protein [Pyrinomonadaceae bacterium]